MLETIRTFDEEGVVTKLNTSTMHLANALAHSRDPGFNARKLSALFSEHQECIFLKDRSGRFIFSNESCTNFFAQQVRSPVGLKSSSLLSNSLKEISQMSDELILKGCERLKFKHQVELVNEGPLSAITVKLPLLSADKSIQGIIGISQTLRPARQKVSDQELQRLGLIVNSMREEEKLVAKYVCDGVSNKSIAHRLDAPLRTIENRRRNVLKKLGIDSTAELIKIMVRIEDAGLTQLGV